MALRHFLIVKNFAFQLRPSNCCFIPITIFTPSQLSGYSCKLMVGSNNLKKCPNLITLAVTNLVTLARTKVVTLSSTNLVTLAGTNLITLAGTNLVKLASTNLITLVGTNLVTLARTKLVPLAGTKGYHSAPSF